MRRPIGTDRGPSGGGSTRQTHRETMHGIRLRAQAGQEPDIARLHEACWPQKAGDVRRGKLAPFRRLRILRSDLRMLNASVRLHVGAWRERRSCDWGARAHVLIGDQLHLCTATKLTWTALAALSTRSWSWEAVCCSAELSSRHPRTNESTLLTADESAHGLPLFCLNPSSAVRSSLGSLGAGRGRSAGASTQVGRDGGFRRRPGTAPKLNEPSDASMTPM